MLINDGLGLDPQASINDGAISNLLGSVMFWPMIFQDSSLREWVHSYALSQELKMKHHPQVEQQLAEYCAEWL